MNDYKVSIEINVSAENPLDAAKEVEKSLREDRLQYYVQDENTNEITSVDLSEDDEDAVLPVTNYHPFIEQL
jgi:hypothetical protein